MNDVTQQCVSLASGTLSPDLRVDYQFGLVLGVNEFRQEQEYFLEKDYLYDRELHGFGTASGLKVTATPLSDNDALITIEAGMALDQWGRPVVIRNPQCARLGAWLAKREQQNPGEIASHRGASDDFHLYVVVSYDECEDALVPIPGQPCSSGDALQAPSRIRDSFNIGLRWEPPSMPAWDAVRCFAKLMAQVRIVPELALNLSDEDTIIEHVRQLNQPCPDDFFSSPPTGSPPDQFFQLPAATARDALDRIFTVWVTEVRPELLPNLLDPGTSEAGILLARIDFTYDSTSKAIMLLGPSPDNTDADGRPFLLHTQLIQELLLLGSGGDVQVIHEPSKVEREFATLQVRDGQTLRAWVHHPDIVTIPPGTSADWTQILELKSDGVVLSIQDVFQGSDAASMNVFDISINPFNNDTPQVIEPGARVELTFKLAGFQLQSGESLQNSIDSLDFDYVGHDRATNTLTAYTIVDKIPAVQEFATFVALPGQSASPAVRAIATEAAIAEGTLLVLWFHTKEPINLPAQVKGVHAVSLTSNQDLLFDTVSPNNDPTVFSYFWGLRLASTGKPPEPNQLPVELLTIFFDTHTIHSGSATKTLTDAIKEQQLTFVGYDGDHTIELHHQIQAAPTPQPPPIVQPSVAAVEGAGAEGPGGPIMPFVTITRIPDAGPNRNVATVATFELWLHLTADPVDDTASISEKLTFEVLAELSNPPSPPNPSRLGAGSVSSVTQIQPNVFTTVMTLPALESNKSMYYLRFRFPLDGNPVSIRGGQSFANLGEYIRSTGIRFEGYNGSDAIVSYVRIPVLRQS